MRDTEERDRIREHFAAHPGEGHHVERAHGELENAVAYGNEGAAERARAEIDAYGYETRDQRERREAADARKRAREEKASEGKADGGKADAPEGRTAPPRQQTTSAKSQRQTG